MHRSKTIRKSLWSISWLIKYASNELLLVKTDAPHKKRKSGAGMPGTQTGLLHTLPIKLCNHWQKNATANVLNTREAELLPQPGIKEICLHLEQYFMVWSNDIVIWYYWWQHCRTKGTTGVTYLPLSGPPLPLTNSSDKLTSKSSSRRQRVETPVQLWLVNTPYSVTKRTGSPSMVWCFKDDQHYPCIRKTLHQTVTVIVTLTTWLLQLLKLLLKPKWKDPKGMWKFTKLSGHTALFTSSLKAEKAW